MPFTEGTLPPFFASLAQPNQKPDYVFRLSEKPAPICDLLQMYTPALFLVARTNCGAICSYKAGLRYKYHRPDARTAFCDVEIRPNSEL